MYIVKYAVMLVVKGWFYRSTFTLEKTLVSLPCILVFCIGTRSTIDL